MKRLNLLGVIISICIVVLILLIVFAGAACIIIIKDNNTAKMVNNKLLTDYQYSETLQIYYDDEESLTNAKDVLSDVEKLLPKNISQLIKSQWKIVVSKSEPFPNTTSLIADGITYTGKGVIWLDDDFNNKVLVHEVGHAVDEYLGKPSEKSAFMNLYIQYWESYKEKGTDKIDKHSVSSPSEFFATMFEEYILYPSYVKEEASEIYSYFDKLTNNNWMFSPGGHFVNLWYHVGYSTINGFVNFFSLNRPFPNAKSVSKKVNEVVATREELVLDEYNAKIDISWMSEDTMKIAEIILELSKNPEAYPCEKHNLSYGYMVEFDYPWPIDMYTEILSFTSAYFGDEGLDPIDVNVVNGKTTRVIIKHEEVLTGEKNRIDSLQKVEDVLKTLKSGNNTEIAVQIANYIYNYASYKTEKQSSFNSFWENKKGDCVMYALIFKQFMDRLGIKNDIIHVVSDQGEGHVYNRIFDGTAYRYYDISYGIFDVEIIDKAGYHINTWQVE